MSKRNLPVIIQRHIFLATSDISKKKFQLIVEEYDGEALSYDEANNVRKLLKGGNLISSNIAILAQWWKKDIKNKKTVLKKNMHVSGADELHIK